MRLYLFCLCLILVGCTSEDVNIPFFYMEGVAKDISDNLEVVSAEGVNIGPQGKFGKLTNLIKVGDNLLLQDSKSDDILVSMDLQSNNILSILSRGEGPNKIKDNIIKLIDYSASTNSVQFFHFMDRAIKGVRLDMAYKLEQLYTIDNNLGFVQSAVHYDDGNILVGFNDESIKLLGDYKDSNFRVASGKVIHSNVEAPSPKDIAMNRELGCIFTHSIYLNYIDCHKLNGDYLYSFGYGKNENLSNEVFENKHMYYYNVKTEGNFLYALYADFDIVDNFVEALIPHLKPQLHVFNLSEKSMEKIIKFDRLINACVIDFDNEKIYAIEEDNEERPLVVYNL